MTTEDRQRGALWGLAVGDALGTTVEFEPPGSFAPVADIAGGGPFGLEPGQWTDDTSMALCLAESIVERGGFDPADQMRRYVRWWREGHLSATGRCFDIGNQTRAALAAFAATGEPFSGAVAERNSGNGSLMRLSPVAIGFRRDPERAVALGAESSRTTHGSRLCVDSCRYFAGLLVGAMDGADKQTLLSAGYAPAPNASGAQALETRVAAIANGSFRKKQPPDIRGTGFVLDCLEAALWSVWNNDTFESAVLAAVNLGEDADTTGAVCGQLAGALYGKSGIPASWLNKVARPDWLERYANALIEFSKRVMIEGSRVAGGR